MTNLINTIEKIFEMSGSEITVNGNEVYVQSFDTDAVVLIHLDPENEFYMISEFMHINDMPVNTVKFNSFNEVVEFIEENY